MRGNMCSIGTGIFVKMHLLGKYSVINIITEAY